MFVDLPELSSLSEVIRFFSLANWFIVAENKYIHKHIIRQVRKDIVSLDPETKSSLVLLVAGSIKNQTSGACLV